MFDQIKNLLGGVAGYFGADGNLRAFDLGCQQMQLSLNRLEGAQFEARSQLVAARDKAISEAVESRMHEAPLEVLGLYAARYQVLLRHGIHRVGDLTRHDRHSLESLAGVGPATSSSILEAYARWCEHVKETTVLTLNPDQLTNGEEALLEAAARYEAVSRELPARLDELRDKQASLEPCLDWIARQREQGIAFSANRQHELLAYLRTIQPHVEKLTHQSTSEYHHLRALPSAGPNSPTNRFSRNSAWFFAIMDSVASLPRQGKPIPPPLVNDQMPTSDQQGGSSGPKSHHQIPSPAKYLRRGLPVLRRLIQRPRTGTSPPREAAPVPTRLSAPTELHEPISNNGIHGELPVKVALAVEAQPLHRGPLIATLRRYQQFGAQYMLKQEKVLLGDDMGLGKTVQVLAAMCHLHANGRKLFLVVAPNSVLTNWEREVVKHTRLKSYVLHGPDRLRTLEQWKQAGGVGVTTYGTLGALLGGLHKIDMLAVDEAHLAKNNSASRTGHVRTAAGRSDYVALMSGTALENRISELHALVVLAQPGIKGHADYLISSISPTAEEARRRVAPVYLRRTQKDVLLELPEMTKVDEYIELSEEELNSPEALKGHLMNRRQATTIGLGKGVSSKYRRLQELLDFYRTEGRKVAVFSTFRKVLDDVSALVGGCMQITGDHSAQQRMQTIDSFSAQIGFAVIVLQVEAGGVGINLQAAQVVVLMEPQLKPSTENQAIARVHRMGQSRNVMVHRLVALKSIDEDMVRLVAQKQAIFDTYAHQSAVKDESSMAIDSSSVQHEMAEELMRRDDERRRQRAAKYPPAPSFRG